MPLEAARTDECPDLGRISPWLDTIEAARYLGKEPGTLKGWRSKGEGPPFHVVSRQFIRYHVDALDAFIRADGGKNLSAKKSPQDKSMS